MQHVSRVAVIVENKSVGSIGRGYLVLLGFPSTDTYKNADKLADKISKLRIFEDENGKINLSISDVGGDILIISHLLINCEIYG